MKADSELMGTPDKFLFCTFYELKMEYWLISKAGGKNEQFCDLPIYPLSPLGHWSVKLYSASPFDFHRA